MKKIINQPETVVAEMCSGLAIAQPELKYIQKYKIIKKREMNRHKVTLISGGGSGHEPAHAGFVGTGMLDAAVCGDVFASPSQIQIYQGIKETAGEQGTLLIIKNYSGDVMNFSNAAAMAKEEGIKVDYVKVEDDIAVKDSLYTVGRRGVAGTVLVHKAAGAAAEEGCTLAEVKRIAQMAADHVRTIGFAYSSCVVPAAGAATFEIGSDEMEYGVGIHGEPGRSREKTVPANEIAERMIGQLLEDINAAAGDEVTLLINGFGSTPQQELYILNYAAAKALAANNITIYRSFAGNFMTSIDMAGASISIMKMNDTLKKYIDLPSSAPGFRVDGAVKGVQYMPIPSNESKAVPPKMNCGRDWNSVSKDSITLNNVTAMVKTMAECIIRNEVEFCKLDSYAGDGDFGMSVAKGFICVKREWDELLEHEHTTIKAFLLGCSMIIMENCGGASGPIWGSAFRAAALAAGDKTVLTIAEFAEMMQAAAAGIQKTGERSFGRGAVVGDKTLIDALVPCANMLRSCAAKGLTVKESMKMAADAAVEGSAATEKIVARMGRAGVVGERSLGYPDAGAHALGVIFTEITEMLDFI